MDGMDVDVAAAAAVAVPDRQAGASSSAEGIWTANAAGVYGNLTAKLVDLKAIGKPPNFTGKDEDWMDWRFRFEVVAGMLELEDAMTLAVAMQTPIALEDLPMATRAKSRLLYGLLVMTVQGRALTRLKAV